MPTWLTDWLASWSDVAAPISAMAAIITGIIAVATLAASARDSYARTRPFVVPYAKIGPTFTHGALYLVIENFGATPAHNITVSFDPPLPDVKPKGDDQPFRDHCLAAIRTRYANEIQVLAPGQNLVNSWTNRTIEKNEQNIRDDHAKRVEREGDKAPDLRAKYGTPAAPDALTVTVRYTDLAKRDWKSLWFTHRRHAETVPLRMSDFDWETRQNPGDSNEVDTRRAKAVEAVAWEMWG